MNKRALSSRLRHRKALLRAESRENAQLKAALSQLQQRLFDREQLDSAISEENTVYKAIFDAQSDLGEGFFIVDGRKIVQVNEAFTRISGYSSAELHGLDSFLDLVPEDERAGLRERMDERLSGRDVHDHYETAIVHRDGHRVILEVAVKVIHLGTRPRILAIARDITERKRMEQALQDQNHRLQELDALKSCFISTVSHELRTPLATVMGYTEFLEERIGGPLTGEQAHYVAQIHAGAQRLEILVDDLLDFARLEAGTLRLNCEESDLVQTLRQVDEEFTPLAQVKGIDLQLRVSEASAPLIMDGMRIEQVVKNLLSNAFKFTPPGGQVRLSLALDDAEARVEITDSGIGIGAQHLPFLFDRFYQVDPSSTRAHGGAGLGLPISKALVESHGGRIGVRSQEKQGSTFWFSLPRDGCVHRQETVGFHTT